MSNCIFRYSYYLNWWYSEYSYIDSSKGLLFKSSCVDYFLSNSYIPINQCFSNWRFSVTRKLTVRRALRLPQSMLCVCQVPTHLDWTFRLITFYSCYLSYCSIMACSKQAGLDAFFEETASSWRCKFKWRTRGKEHCWFTRYYDPCYFKLHCIARDSLPPNPVCVICQTMLSIDEPTLTIKICKRQIGGLL